MYATTTRPRLTVAFMLVAASVLVSMLVWAARAQAGAYVVSQCEPAVNPRVDSKHHESGGNNQYRQKENCGNPGGDPPSAVSVYSSAQAPNGNGGWHRWTAPASTTIVKISVRARLQRHSGHKARLLAGGSTFGYGNASSWSWKNYAWEGSGRCEFKVRLGCEKSPNCSKSSEAGAQAKRIRLTLRDSTYPTISATGGLLGDGWRRESAGLSAVGADTGGGVRAMRATVNGSRVAQATYDCSLISGREVVDALRPCRGAETLSVGALDTAEFPFSNGTNAVQVCVWDFGTSEPANNTCKRFDVKVDNLDPQGTFRNSEDASDPELIRAPVSDAHSGVADGRIYYRRIGQSSWVGLPTDLVGGELRARVDSEAVAAGDYEFKLGVTDVAGNEAEATTREDGSSMVLSFPLRTATTIDAALPGGSERQTVAYRQDSEVSGRLTTESGKPIGGAEVTVTERFDSGSLIDERIRIVTTGSDGRFGSKLPGGPSRRISVSYAGSRKYSGDRGPGLDFNTRSKVGLRTSKRTVRAGQRVRFRGNVRRYFAAIPPGGKLIELQVKEGARKWGTVREAFPTEATGRYRLRYRFKRFYTEPTKFKFRVKVTKEQGWPYKAPGRSRAREVRIVPR